MEVSGLVLTSLAICFEVSSTLYGYGKQVKGARRDIQNLGNELFGLIGALEHLKLQQENQAKQDAEQLPAPPYSLVESMDPKTDTRADVKEGHGENLASVLEQTIDFLGELQQSLASPKGRFKNVVQVMKWPLRDSEVQKHLARLERVKTYFILSMITDEVDQSREMANEIRSLRTLVQGMTLKQEAGEARHEHRDMTEWLCPVDPGVTRRAIEKQRMPGTGSWLVKSEHFQSQATSKMSSCFWLNGITGAGKTTLITTAIGELVDSQEEKSELAYFYCAFSNDESLHTQNILGSILAQICNDSDAVYHETRALYAQLTKDAVSKAKTRLDIDVLVDLIIRQAKTRSRVYLIIDGVNECTDPHGVLGCFEKILTAVDGVQLVVSSINERGIDRCIDRMPKSYEVTIKPQTISSDINLLVRSALATHLRLKELPKSLKDEIVDKLTDRAEGMFRWVQCQLDLLSRLRTPGAVQKALGSLPPTLDKTYESLLGRIDGEEDRSLTRDILQAAAFSLRPLTLTEVSIVLQITPGTTSLDESKCLTHPKDILDICGSLLRYNEKTDIVYLAHHSVYVYLTSDPKKEASYFRLDKQEAHRNMALLCLTYLSFDVFSAEEDLSNERVRDLLFEEYPFLDYATEKWAPHTRRVTDLSEPLWSTLRLFLLSANDDRSNFANWVQLLTLGSLIAKHTPPLYYAASYGLTTIVQYLLKLGVDVEVHAGRGGATPINIAAYRGHLDVVKLLLEHGADPTRRDRLCNVDAVGWAQFQGRRHVVEYFKGQGYGWSGKGDDTVVAFK